MFNEIFGLIFVLINFSLVLLMYRMFGKTGLFVWVGFSTVLCNLQVIKSIEIFGMTATLGNSMYATAFLVTDIINERYGKNEAKKAVWLGFFTLIAMTLIMQMVLVFHPGAEDISQSSLENIFGLLPQLAIASLAAYITSQYTDVLIFSAIRKRFPKDSQFWIRNNGSTLISQLLDTLVFTSIGFWGIYSLDVWFQIFMTTYILKAVISIIGTPFGYAAKRFKFADENDDQENQQKAV